MRKNEMYEIRLASHLALWLIRWKTIAAVGAVCALAFLLLSCLTFRAPERSAQRYWKIESAISERESLEEQLSVAKRVFEENLFYAMDPETLLRQQAAFAVEVEEKNELTDKFDPADPILIAYYNLTVSKLENLLVPTILTKMQYEQLCEITIEPGANVFSITMTADDPALTDKSLSAVTQWILQQQEDVTKITQPHSVTALPVHILQYDRETAERLTSDAEAQTAIWKIESKIYSCNDTLEEGFHKPEDWASGQSVAQLREKLNLVLQMDREPPFVFVLMVGFLLGAFASVVWLSLGLILSGSLIAYDDVADATGWRKIGRLNSVPDRSDPIVRLGWTMLYSDAPASMDTLKREISEITMLLMKDRGMELSSCIGLIGNAPEAQMLEIGKILAPVGCSVAYAQLNTDRVGANQLVRKADAVIFVGTAGAVTMTEAELLMEIVSPLGEKTLGYILV